MNPILIICLVVVAYLVWSCGPKTNTLVTGQHNGHTLILSDRTAMASIGDLSHLAVLTFDGKPVSDSNVGLPLFPDLYPQSRTWIIQEKGPDQPLPDRMPWTVYVSPKTFSRADFDALEACFDANRAAFDAALDSMARPGYITRGRICRLVYGLAPELLVFKPAQNRYQPVRAEDTTVNERITIQPDGRWAFTLWSTDGKGSSMGGNILTDTLHVENSRLTMRKPFDTSQERMFKPSPDKASVSDIDYLRSFADSTGRPLLTIINYPFATPKQSPQ
jgi:hypothetical protein